MKSAYADQKMLKTEFSTAYCHCLPNRDNLQQKALHVFIMVFDPLSIIVKSISNYGLLSVKIKYEDI